MQHDALDVACPFLQSLRRGDGDSTPTAADALRSSAARKASEYGMKETLQLIITKRLGLHNVDVFPLADALEKELVAHPAILFSLDEDLLSRLHLPVALEDAIRKLIRIHKGTGVRSDASGSIDAQKSLRAAALFGLKTNLRQAVITSWSIINTSTQKGTRNAPDFTLSRFFDEFMKNFLEMSPNAKSIFGSLNVLSQGKIILRMIHVIAKAAEDPAQGSVVLKKQAAQHVIFGVNRKDFEAFSLSIIKSLEATLPPAEMTPAVREGWYAAASASADFMLACYDDIKTGSMWPVWRKSGQKWRRFQGRLTERRFLLTKASDDETKKVKEEIDLFHAAECEPIHEEVPAKPAHFCFHLTMRGGEKIYFCTTSDDLRAQLVEEIARRIHAWHTFIGLHPDMTPTSSPGSILGRPPRSSTLSHMSMKRDTSSKDVRDISTSEEESSDDISRSSSGSVTKLEPVFENLLLDQHLSRDFYKFLVTIQAHHMFDFYQQVMSHWRKQNFTDTSEAHQKSLLAIAQDIFNRFLSLQSDTCVSIADDQRNSINRVLKQGKMPVAAKLFDQAINEISHLLRGHFVTFRSKQGNN